MLRQRQRQTPYLTYLFFAAVVILMTACETRPPKPVADSDRDASIATAGMIEALAAQAQAAEDQGNLAAAARLYQELARHSISPQREDYQLNAAATLTRGGYLDEADHLLQAIADQPLTPQQQLQHRIVAARVALQRQAPEQALAQLNLPATYTLPAEHTITLTRLRAEAYTQQGDYPQATRERVWLDELLTDPEAVHNNRLVLWQTVSALDPDALQALITAPPPDAYSGWLELALRVKTTTHTPQQLQPQLQTWRQRYPAHSGAQFLTALLTDDGTTGVGGAHNIALLLPLTGNFAAPASAVRDGFLAAYFAGQAQTTAQSALADNATLPTQAIAISDSIAAPPQSIDNPRQPTPRIRIYDTASDIDQALSAYRLAVDEGADLIVGPLNKHVVEALVQTQDIPVTTLALNYSQSDSDAANFFQFGLLPEDEARQVAERAWLDGHNRALVLTPGGEWGERMRQSFADHWQLMGGAIAEFQTYDQSGFDFSGPLEQLLNIDHSEQRKRRLQRLVGKELNYEPRRRSDIDFIFAAAFPQQARQIRPQLKFHYAGDVPIYSTSHTYSGQVNDALDRDMDGIMFCDMPWVLNDTQAKSPNWRQISQLWPGTAGAYQRLYAMGVDAYLLIPWLKYLQLHPEEHLQGETGQLFLDVENRVHRQLLWARLHQGRPQLLETRP